MNGWTSRKFILTLIGVALLAVNDILQFGFIQQETMYVILGLLGIYNVTNAVAKFPGGGKPANPFGKK